MLALERKNIILQLLSEQSAVSVSSLTQMFNVSEITVRKILNNLAEEGLLRRTNGGAVSLSVPVRESDLRTKEKTNSSQKKSIAQKAYGLVEDYDNIFLDSGTTTLELARLIKDGKKRNIRLITNALNIATELLDSPDIEVLLIGGRIRRNVLSCVGPLAERTVSLLGFDKAFLGASNVSVPYGVTTPKIAEAQIKQSVILSAEQAILLCDSSKFGGASLVKICDLEEFDAIITDNGLPGKTREEFSQAGIALILAKVRPFK